MLRQLATALALILALPPSGLASDLPAMADKVAREFRVYQKKTGFKTFAMNATGAYGYSYKAVSSEIADELALRSCDASREKLATEAKRAPPCQIVDRGEP